MSPGLTVHRLNARGCRGAPALTSIDFAASAGEIIGLVGDAKSGASCLLHCLMALEPMSSGRIELNGVILSSGSTHLFDTARRVRSGLSLTPQGQKLFPELTVEEHLQVSCQASRKERRKIIAEIYDIFPVLSCIKDRLAWQLSGGQAQILAIARSFTARPQVLLLDSPGLGLSPRLQADLVEYFRLIAGRGSAIIIAEQPAFPGWAICHRLHLMEKGQIIKEGDWSLLQPHLSSYPAWKE